MTGGAELPSVALYVSLERQALLLNPYPALPWETPTPTPLPNPKPNPNPIVTEHT